MRVLIINSSPRRKGNISRLLDRAAQGAVSAGADCRVINLYEKDIRQCVACMVCRTKLSCPIPDDMSEIADAVTQADRIVIGAPCYWANMPGVLKTMFDRLALLRREYSTNAAMHTAAAARMSSIIVQSIENHSPLHLL